MGQPQRNQKLIELLSKKDLFVFQLISRRFVIDSCSIFSLLRVCILIAVIAPPGSMQYISSFVAQKGAMVKLEKAESIKGEKFVNVSAFISYLDMPVPVPIQILCRLSSLNA